ncbi:TRAP transporter small permease [Aeromonas hydrophila]|uniref:TRAP transporter small permease n=1 Tax=Aeromonas hydrophila TaxID=644 RepID=UPI0009B8C07E|nr:TRAP transporter small permease [Aeromonas hydrophila]
MTKKIDFNLLFKFLSVLSLNLMVLLVFINALMRYFFNSGLPWSEELARICFVYTICFGIVIGVKEKNHLKVDIITNILPVKINRIISIVSNCICIGVMGILFFGAYDLIILTYDQQMPATKLSSAWLYACPAFAASIYFCSAIKNIIKP